MLRKGEARGKIKEGKERIKRRTYGSRELSGTSCIVDPHIGSSVIRDAALSVLGSREFRMEHKGYIGLKNKALVGEEREGRVKLKRGTEGLTSSLMIGICSSLYASNAALNRRLH